MLVYYVSFAAAISRLRGRFRENLMFSMIRKIKLFYHTVRYLKPIQIFTRIRYRFFPPQFKEAPAVVPRKQIGSLTKSVPQPRSMYTNGRVKLQNREFTLPESGTWDIPELGKVLNLAIHCHEDLHAADSPKRFDQQREYIHDWIDRHPPIVQDAWIRYNISRRIQRWIFWSLRGGDLGRKGLRSLANQIWYLARVPEYHVQGNHIWENWVALLMGGLFFEGPEADRLYRSAGKQLSKVFKEQLTPDGGQEERSTAYNAWLLETLLDLYNLHIVYDRTFPSSWLEVIQKMLDWLRMMTHPDGEVAMFNDGNFQMAKRPEVYFEYAERLGLEPPPLFDKPRNELLASGYARLETDGTVVLFDAAPIGPDHVPGHGHADTLSFEASRAGRRIIVNTGTSQYDNNDEREYERSTAAHSTLVLAGRSSSEMWASFRVGRRARIVQSEFRNEGDSFIVSAAHDGYVQQLKTGLHQRTARLSPGSLMITDHLQGSGEFPVEIFFHFAPGIQVVESGSSRQLELQNDSGRFLMKMSIPEGLRHSVEESRVAKGFNLLQPNLRIRLSGIASLPNKWATTFTW
jgi:uncharacterized heparinase superfamily protein